MNLIYQVAIGKSKLYDQCIQSVADYAHRIGAEHIVQREPILKIRPDMKVTNRSYEAVERLGYLPIFEKEAAFNHINDYENIAVIDADVYVKRSCQENIFDILTLSNIDSEKHLEELINCFKYDGNKSFLVDNLNSLNEKNPLYVFAAMREMDLPMQDWYAKKLKTYSQMQYGSLWPKDMFKNGIAKFRNMGVMAFNCSRIKKYIEETPEKFIHQARFKKFVDGQGNWKWSTDQTLLNQWLYEDGVPTVDLDWKFNCLYTAVKEEALKEAYFVHFFLRDKLPNRGESLDIPKLLGDL